MIRPLQCLACLLAISSLTLCQQESAFNVTVQPVNGTKSDDKLKNDKFTYLEDYLKIKGHVGSFVDFDPAEGFTLKNRIANLSNIHFTPYTENIVERADFDANLAFVQTPKESLFIDFGLPAEKGFIRFDSLAPKTFSSFGNGKGFGVLGNVVQKEGVTESATEIHLVTKIQDKWRASSYYSPITNYVSMKFRLVVATGDSTTVACYARTAEGSTEYIILEVTAQQVKLVDEKFITTDQKTDRFEALVLEETKDQKLTRYFLALTQEAATTNATTIFNIYAFGADNVLTRASTQIRLLVLEDDTSYDRLSCSLNDESRMQFQCVYTDANKVTRVVELSIDSSKFAQMDFVTEVNNYTLDTLVKQGMRPLCQNPMVESSNHCSDATTLGNMTVVRVENSKYDPKANKTGILAEKYQAFVYAHTKTQTVFRTLGIQDLGIDAETQLDQGLTVVAYTSSETNNDVKIGALSTKPEGSTALKFESNGVGIFTKKQQKYHVHQQLAVRQLDGELSKFTLDEILVVEKSLPPIFNSKLIVYAALGFLALLVVMGVMYVFLNKLCGDMVTVKPVEEEEGELSEKLTSGGGASIAPDSVRGKK